MSEAKRELVVRFHSSWPQCDHPQWLVPHNERRFRSASMAEVVGAMACFPWGPFSKINVDVPRGVPVWQYVG